MHNSIYRFTLDIHTLQSQTALPVMLGDTARKLSIRFTEKGQPYLLPDGTRAVFSAKKADGKAIFNDCVILDNRTVEYGFTKQTANVPGVTDCQVILYGADGEILASPRFTMTVDSRVTVDADIPISETESSSIDNIATAETARVAAEAARTAAENTRKQAENIRADAEKIRIQNDRHRRVKKITHAIDTENIFSTELEADDGTVIQSNPMKLPMTVKGAELPNITDIAAFRAYFYGLCKNPNRKYQYEIDGATGRNTNLIRALGGFPEGANPEKKYFLYIEIPYSEDNGFTVITVLQGVDTPCLYESVQWKVSDSDWKMTAWLNKARMGNEVKIVDVFPYHDGSYRADASASEIAAIALQNKGHVKLHFEDAGETACFDFVKYDPKAKIAFFAYGSNSDDSVDGETVQVSENKSAVIAKSKHGIVQTIGDSITDMMSQKAVTDALYEKANRKTVENLDSRVDYLEHNTLEFIENDSTAYTKDVPAGVSENAVIPYYGGMTCKSKNLCSVNEITFKQQKVFSIGTVPAGTYHWSFFLDCPPNSTGTCLCELLGGPADKPHRIGNQKWIAHGVTVNMTITAGEPITGFNFYAGANWNDAKGKTATVKALIISKEKIPFEPYFEGLRDSKVTAFKSVKSDGTAVATIPVPADVLALPDYGVGIDGAHCNYVDWDKKEYNQTVVSGPYRAGDEALPNVVTDGITKTVSILDKAIVTDISAILPDNIIKVQGGGTVTAVNEHNQALPWSVGFVKPKTAGGVNNA